METPKKFRIAKIIDETSFIITGGSEDGITNDDKFQILGKEKETIVDPETGDMIGTLDTIKGTIVASQVYDNMTLCRSKWITTKSPLNNMLGNEVLSIANSLYEGYHQELNVDQDAISGGLTSNDPIRIGDYAIKLSK